MLLRKKDKIVVAMSGGVDSSTVAAILNDMTWKGVDGIKKVFMRQETATKYDEATGCFRKEKEWVLDTDGCNLEQVRRKEVQVS